MDEILHVAFKKYKIKRKFPFFLLITKNISFREFQTSEFSLALRNRENYDGFNTLGEIYLVYTSKSKYPLCIIEGAGSMNLLLYQIMYDEKL